MVQDCALGASEDKENDVDRYLLLTPLKTTEHTPRFYQTPFLLCLIWLVCFYRLDWVLFSQLKLANFVAQQ